ncbi:MAG: DNA adenine methylase, partial [Lactococcus lactis]|nr:DNA adenine methylase [Lactococcus lactis]
MRYIGSKLKLLTEIQEFLSQNIQSDNKIFLDLFGGSNIVGSYFKKDYQILTNDLLYFSYAIAQGKIVNNEQPQFLELKKRNIENPLDYLNNSTNFSDYIGYYEKEYSPTGEAMYFSVENAKRIDFIRDEIDSWKEQDLLSESEYFYLLASLLEAIPFVSNTTGTYGAFLKKWDKRALKKLELLPLDLTNNKQHNQAFNENSNELVKKISADITYIDTPYNKRQYAPNYHVLENIARNDKPELSGKTRLFDYKKLKSDYSNAKLALDAMENLIKNLDTTHIILSYNNEGIIPETDLIGLLKKYTIDGNINIKKIPYRKYKSKNPSDSYDLYELLIYIQKKKVLENKKIRIHSKKQVLLPKYVKSPLNYIGGKYKLLPQILPLFPDNIDTFVDLFSGGANVGINVQANHHIFNDMNNRMNEMFRYFATENPQELIIKIKNRISEYQLSKENEQAYLNF